MALRPPPESLGMGSIKESAAAAALCIIPLIREPNITTAGRRVELPVLAF
jgi:hypothetical protein